MKIGKTTALLVGASAIGIGTERDLPNWNATSNAFLETARGFNDLVLPANEVGLLAGKRRDAYAPIRERIYAFSEGRDRARGGDEVRATPSPAACAELGMAPVTRGIRAQAKGRRRTRR